MSPTPTTIPEDDRATLVVSDEDFLSKAFTDALMTKVRCSGCGHPLSVSGVHMAVSGWTRAVVFELSHRGCAAKFGVYPA